MAEPPVGKVSVKFTGKLGNLREPIAPKECDPETTMLQLRREMEPTVIHPSAPPGTHLIIFVATDAATGEAFVPTPDTTIGALLELFPSKMGDGKAGLMMICSTKVYQG